MTSGPTCRCLLCRVEKQLADELASSIAAYDAIRGSAANGLREFDSPFHLLSHLKATQAGPSSDDLFRELLAARAVERQFVENLMIVAFVPVLHGTVRRIAKQQLQLTRADITQQALSVFLQVLRSERIENVNRTLRSQFPEREAATLLNGLAGKERFKGRIAENNNKATLP